MSGRLEEIKSDWVEKQKTYQFRPLTLEMNDVNWLIEQAERIDYLEKVYKFETNQHEKYKKIAVEVTSELEAENTRLREALEFYADKDNYVSKQEFMMNDLPSNIEFECGDKARQALEANPNDNR